MHDWANGSAPLVRKSTKEETEVVLVVSDIHVPFQDTALVNSAVRLAKRLKPHRVIVNGDLLDMNEISRFAKPAEITLGGLQEQFDAGHGVLNQFRNAAPNAVLSFTLGNHEARFEKFLGNFPPLAGLRAMTLENQLDLKSLGYDYFDGAGLRLRKNLVVKHGHVVRKHATWSAKAEMESAGISGVSGHTHRLGVFRHSAYTKTQWAEGGCLCLTEPDYVVGPANWQPGAILIQISTKSDSFLMEEVQAMDASLWYGGRSY